jgi:hypothetical protein
MDLKLNGRTKLMASEGEERTGAVMAIFTGWVITGAVIAMGFLPTFAGSPNTPMYLSMGMHGEDRSGEACSSSRRSYGATTAHD